MYACTERACYDGPQFADTVTTEATEEHTEISETNGQVCTPNETKMQVSENLIHKSAVFSLIFVTSHELNSMCHHLIIYYHLLSAGENQVY